VEAILSKDSRVMAAPEAQIAVSELGDSSVNLVVRPWCKKEDYWALRFDLVRRFKEELEQAGCSIPYPRAMFTSTRRTEAPERLPIKIRGGNL
jgi:small conductance mechanosensitive channel